MYKWKMREMVFFFTDHSTIATIEIKVQSNNKKLVSFCFLCKISLPLLINNMHLI